MQIFYWPAGLTVIICFLLWLIFQLAPVLICLKLPDSIFQHAKFIFRTFRWEDEGRIYSRLFQVQRWKKRLPDGGALFGKGLRKKQIDCHSLPALDRFLTESCRGELSHWLAILPVWVFGLFTPPGVLLIMIVYALALNMPCIIAQRFNRPRICALSTRLRMRDAATSE
ncbi:MAG: glycosyl-4,4'-diaponeurosporenoate acyltransferase CrtO family protein [Saccharofermentanales bacterium]